MEERMKPYKLEGHYFWQGQREYQGGELVYFQDGKIVGQIGDNNNGGSQYTNKKLLLGTHDRQTGRIHLAKISPGLRRGQDLHPIMWSFNPIESDRSHEEIEGVYHGHFDLVSVPGVEIAEAQMFVAGIPHPRELSNLTYRQVEDMFKFEATIDYYAAECFERGQEGMITISSSERFVAVGLQKELLN